MHLPSHVVQLKELCLQQLAAAPPGLQTYAVQVVWTLELYCGCGGLSFADRHTKEVIIKTKWAVDYEASMTDTFQANYPYAHVSVGLLCPAVSLCISHPLFRCMPESCSCCCLGSVGMMDAPAGS